MTTTTTILSRLGALCALIAGQCALAAPINYGDFQDFADGGVVLYTDVTESSATSAVPLYDAPDIDINLLDFDPVGFGASAGGANPSPFLVDGQLNFGFETLPGTGIDSFTFSEGGDYSFIGSPASVGFGIFAKITVTEVNGIALAPEDQFAVIGSNSNSVNAVGGFSFNNPWNLGLLVELGPALAANGFAAGSFVTAGEVVINDTLGASAGTDASAFIAKKDFKVTPGGRLDPDNVIPEPTTALLAIVGLGALAARRV